MREPRLSVLLPTHNRADVLGYAIGSVLWQSEADFELLVVGDGCTDHSEEIVATFRDPRIRWFDLPKAPFSGYANRNIALRQARGRYVAYAQHDDLWFPDHAVRLISSLESAHAEWGYSRPLWVTPEGLILPFAVNLTNEDELDHFVVENHIPSTCVMHTREALERVGFWPEDASQIADWNCWRRMLESGDAGTVGYCPDATALHFRAISKEARKIHPAVIRLEEIARQALWWPAACRVAVPPGAAAQQIIFDALRENPGRFVERMRAASARIIDRLAWSRVIPSALTWAEG